MQNQINYKDQVGTISEKQHTNYSKFIIVSHARSGSNLLLNSLNSHPNLIAEHEIFAAHNRDIGENFQPTLDRLFRNRPESVKAVGCKIFYYHLNKDEWQELSKIPELKVIHLKRKNRLSMIVSMKVAFKTDQWGIGDESERIDVLKKQIHLNEESLRTSFSNIESWENDVTKTFGQHPLKEVYYEDLTSQYENTLDGLFNFLGVTTIPTEMINIKHKKQNPEPLDQLIQNYSELKKKFQNTPWQHYFNC